MPRQIVVRISWTHSSPTEMASFEHGVAAAISNNAETFPAPSVSSSDLDEAANRVEMAYANRMNGPLAKTELDDADTTLDMLLHNEADYVNSVARGNRSIIQLAAFIPTSDTNTTPVVPQTPNAAKITGTAAALTIETAKVNGADSYCWLIFLDSPGAASVGANYIKLPAAPVIVIPNGHLRETLHNVIPAGTNISLQVLAQNTAGKSGFSPLVSFTVGG